MELQQKILNMVLKGTPENITNQCKFNIKQEELAQNIDEIK